MFVICCNIWTYVNDGREACLWLWLTYHTQEAPTIITECPVSSKWGNQCCKSAAINQYSEVTIKSLNLEDSLDILHIIMITCCSSVNTCFIHSLCQLKEKCQWIFQKLTTVHKIHFKFTAHLYKDFSFFPPPSHKLFSIYDCTQFICQHSSIFWVTNCKSRASVRESRCFSGLLFKYTHA